MVAKSASPTRSLPSGRRTPWPAARLTRSSAAAAGCLPFRLPMVCFFALGRSREREEGVPMIQRHHIRSFEAGLHFRNGEFIGLLLPGTHWLFDPFLRILKLR